MSTTIPFDLPFPLEDDPADGATQIQALAEAVAELLVDRMFEAGDIKVTAALHPPSGDWLVCNGQTLSRTDFADLFDAIGTTYGAGDGVSTFAIPDFRGCVVRIDPFELGWRSGNDSVVLTTGQLPAHNHGVADPGHQHYTSMSVAGATDWRGINADAFQILSGASISGLVPSVQQVWIGEGGGGTYRWLPWFPSGNYYSNYANHQHGVSASGGAWCDSRATGISTHNAGSGQAISNMQRGLNVNAFIHI
jgi:microcystin-dependent protein